MSDVDLPGGSILVVDDDVELCALLKEYLGAQGYQVICAHDGPAGLMLASTNPYDLIILDVMLPRLDGFEVLRQLRRRTAAPVIMLTARVEQADRIAGLEGGADDYLLKPFAAGELLARIRAVRRRSGHAGQTASPILTLADVRVNSDTRQVTAAGLTVDLTATEFAILELLMRAHGRIVTRDEISAVLYQREATPYERSVDVHISHLRKKLEGGAHAAIRAIRGVGYTLTAQE
jgi:DNA-binding response OmpR family regulator